LDAAQKKIDATLAANAVCVSATEISALPIVPAATTALAATALAATAATITAPQQLPPIAAEQPQVQQPQPQPPQPSIMASMLHMSDVGDIPIDSKTGADTVTVRSDTTAAAEEEAGTRGGGYADAIAASVSSDGGVMPLSDGNIEFNVATTSKDATITVSAASLVPVTPEDASIEVWYYKEGAITNMLTRWCKDAVPDADDVLVWTVSGLLPFTTYVFKVLVADVGEREQKATTLSGIPEFTVAPSSAKSAFVTLSAGTEAPEDLVIEYRTYKGLTSPSPRWQEATGGRDGDDRLKHHVIGLCADTGYVFRVTRPGYPRGKEVSITTLPQDPQ
jgi:hypothetical protein